MTNDQNLSSIFTMSELKAIESYTQKDRAHPLKRVLFPSGDPDLTNQISVNTDRAVRHILKSNKNWIRGLKPRLMNIDDFSHCSSALGEIRAFGYILESGINIAPAHNTDVDKPDFIIKSPTEEVWIEVHSKQLSKDESKELENFNNNKPQDAEPGKIVVREHIVTPFGKPKKGENVTENVISKITQIKQGEKQFSNNNTSILWLDFQDEIWNIGLNSNQVLPIHSSRGFFYSGALWYAFYGWKGAPIFENQTTEQIMPFIPLEMRHNGRFHGRFKNRSKIDAVIFSFPRETVVFENPYSRHPIKPWLWEHMTFLPWFSYELSYLNIPNKSLRKSLSIQKSNLKSLRKTLKYSI